MGGASLGLTFIEHSAGVQSNFKNVGDTWRVDDEIADLPATIGIPKGAPALREGVVPVCHGIVSPSWFGTKGVCREPGVVTSNLSVMSSSACREWSMK